MSLALIDYDYLSREWDAELLRQLTSRTDSPGIAVERASVYARKKMEGNLRQMYAVPNIFGQGWEQLDPVLQEIHVAIVIFQLHHLIDGRAPKDVAERFDIAMTDLIDIRDGKVSLDLPRIVDPEDGSSPSDIDIDSEPREYWSY